jgi:hypothetical protein
LNQVNQPDVPVEIIPSHNVSVLRLCCKGNEPDCNKVAVVNILEKLLKMPVFDNTGVYFCG